MKIKIDENLPESLVAELVNLRHDVDNVRQEGLAGETMLRFGQPQRLREDS